jgi:hypothetical protein
MISRSLLAILFAVSLNDPCGHWEGVIHAPAMDYVVTFDVAKNDKGQLTGTFSNAAENLRGLPLANVVADGVAVTLALPGGAAVCHTTLDGKSMKGTFTMTHDAKAVDLPIELTRTGDAKIEAAPKSPAISKELEGKWSGTLDVNGTKKNVGLRLVNQPDGTSSGVIISNEGMAFPITLISQKGSSVSLDVKNVGGTYSGTLNGAELSGTWTQGAFNGPLKFTRSSTPVDRWASALGGREKLAGIK